MMKRIGRTFSLKSSSKYMLPHNANKELLEATQIGDVERCDSMIKRGADVNCKHYFNTSYDQNFPNDAEQTKNDGIFNRFLKIKGSRSEGGAFVQISNPDKNGNTPAHYASMGGSSEIMKLLCQNGVDLDTFNEAGAAPIHIAAKNGNCEIINTMAQHGANMDIQDRGYSSAAHMAGRRGHANVIRLLAKYGANLSSRNSVMETPAFLAASHGHFKTVYVLAENGADINAKNKRNISPLYYICRNGDKDLVNYLLSKGANPNSGVGNCLSVALELYHSEIVTSLINAGAHVNKVKR